MRAPESQGTNSYKFPNPDEAFARAKRYILNNAKRRKAKSIDLSNMGLTELPDEICDLTLIERIDLSNNRIASLPDNFGALKSLRSLNIASNRILSIPDSMRQLDSIKYIIANDNLFTEIPQVLLEIDSLEILYIDNCNIKAFPKDIDRDCNLICLTARYNDIETIPKYITKFRRLQILNLYQNKITLFPNGFFNLVTLTQLELAYNRIRIVPDEIRDLHALRLLNLAFNSIGDLNDAIFDLPRLETLYISGNPINQIRSGIGKLTRLKMLSAAQCRLDDFPEDIYDLNNIGMLVLSSNELKSISPKVAALDNLYYLSVDSNELQGLPSELGYMKGLAAEKNLDDTYSSRFVFGENPLPRPFDLIAQQDEPRRTTILMEYLRGELDLSFFDNNDFSLDASDASAPARPELEAGPSFRIAGGKLDLVREGREFSEFEDKLQSGLRRRLIKQLEKLSDITKKVGNIYPDLANTVEEYKAILTNSSDEIEISNLWAVGNALMAQAISFEGQNIERTLTDPLEPLHRALLIDVARLHGSYVLGFAEGRELTNRADLARMPTAALAQIEAPTRHILREVSTNDSLASSKARRLVKSLEDALQVASWETARVGHTSYVTLRNLLIETGRLISLINEKGGGAIGVVALSTTS